jgi:hypothetical protein
MRKKHNYPKNRKLRDVSYSKSYKLLQLIGEDNLHQLFSEHGMYTSAKILSEQLGEQISPYVVRHVRRRYNLGSTLNEEAV